MAILFGILAVLGVLLPWHSQTADNARGGAEMIDFQRGLDGEFFGLYTMLLAAVGTVLLIWFVVKKTSPALSRGLLFGAALMFATGIGLTIVDFGLDLPSGTRTVGRQVIEEGRAFGIYLTLVGCGVALLMTAISILSPKTPYKE